MGTGSTSEDKSELLHFEMLHFSIEFASNYYLYFLVFVAIPFGFFYRARIVSGLADNSFLSKRCTDQLRGLFIVIVVLHHISERMISPGFLVLFRAPLGYFAVGIFLFLSGLGLTKSLKNDQYLDKFLLKKIVRVYTPLVIVNMLTIVSLVLKGDDFSIAQVLFFLLSVKFIDNSSWFIIIILLFYFLFWLSSVVAKDEKFILMLTFLVSAYIVLSKIIGLGGWWYYSSLCFPMGV